ncbi:MAG: ribosomal protein [Candidatus Saccharibacteria bacterium]|nr:ribosomal protein [Candidatus Saccharibacteria bacterium]
MSVPTYTKAGVKATTAAKLPKGIFDLEVTSHELLKQAYTAYMSNSRTVNAHTLKRGEVSGGGRKPWKQKGTGRARFGSIRVPIWRGGGITFGPTGNENFTKELPVKTKRQAIRQALSVKNDVISVIDEIDFKDGKVAPVAALLSKLGATKKVLIVVDAKDEMSVRATRNLADVKVTQARYLNVYDLLNADSVIITAKSLDIIAEWLAPTSAAATGKTAKETK